MDVGCGTGLLNYVIAKLGPRLQILGVDVNQRAVDLANQYNRLNNLRFAAVPLSEVRGSLKRTNFVDVMHHTSEDEARRLLEQAEPLMTGDGQIFIKDIARKGGWFSYARDRYITGSRVIRLGDLEEMLRIVPNQYRGPKQLRKYRFPFPNYYVTLARRSHAVLQQHS